MVKICDYCGELRPCLKLRTFSGDAPNYEFWCSLYMGFYYVCKPCALAKEKIEAKEKIKQEELNKKTKQAWVKVRDKILKENS